MSNTKNDPRLEARRKILQGCPRDVSVHPPLRYYYNHCSQVNPTSTFDAFEIYDEAQRAVLERIRKVAAQLVARKDKILSQEYPFDVGRILFLTSEPGFGKTHLAHAIVNYIADEAPQMLKKVVVAGHKFGYDHQTAASEYGGAPIVIIDDIFSDLQSVSEIHPATDVQNFMRFIQMLYERRIFAIITSNFRLMDDKDGGILARVKMVDKVGRTLSRCQEVLAGSGEIVLPGKDFRRELAERRKSGDDFVL
ncbi:MAG: hypothetical protein K2X27_09510 [Candidatus Obscuribacterales bacterium]|nr:hypothetical protein [Candidatus Obscuribacterales bacterium]